jgi:deoxyribodipyrimidine photolyase-related protein
MNKSWYEGKTGILPLDHVISKAIKYGWNHHIERLMIIANIMNLARISPGEVYSWFMEFYVDSYDWVMVPNVYGMGLFSDGGLFSTKPYICASSYILKMSDYEKGHWTDIVDGLYWKFIDYNREKLKVNPRIGIMTKMIDTMDSERKSRIYSAANKFLLEHTS